jgi:hypothetical protein
MTSHVVTVAQDAWKEAEDERPRTPWGDHALGPAPWLRDELLAQMSSPAVPPCDFEAGGAAAAPAARRGSFLPSWGGLAALWGQGSAAQDAALAGVRRSARAVLQAASTAAGDEGAKDVESRGAGGRRP